MIYDMMSAGYVICYVPMCFLLSLGIQRLCKCFVFSVYRKKYITSPGISSLKYTGQFHTEILEYLTLDYIKFVSIAKGARIEISHGR